MKSSNIVPSDAALVSSYVAGNEQALERLIYRHRQRVYSFIYSKVLDRDIAEDIFQDTFIKVIKTLKKQEYNEQGKFFPWVIRIAHNLVMDFFRKSSRMSKLETSSNLETIQFLNDSEEVNAEETLITEQVEKDLHNLVDKLPKDQKNVLMMRLYQKMSFKEIAQVTNVSINTSLGRMRYAIINLRRLINQHNIILS